MRGLSVGETRCDAGTDMSLEQAHAIADDPTDTPMFMLHKALTSLSARSRDVEATLLTGCGCGDEDQVTILSPEERFELMEGR